MVTVLWISSNPDTRRDGGGGGGGGERVVLICDDGLALGLDDEGVR